MTAPTGSRRRRRNGVGVASLVLGLIALPLSVLLIGGFLFGLMAIGLGMAGRARVRVGVADNPGQALAGIVCGTVAFVISSGVVVLIIIASSSPAGRTVRHCIAAVNGDKTAQSQCPEVMTASPSGSPTP